MTLYAIAKLDKEGNIDKYISVPEKEYIESLKTYSIMRNKYTQTEVKIIKLKLDQDDN